MGIKNRVISYIKPKLLKMRFKNRPFTIVSNNCWGSHIYQHLNIPYTTPFVGTFIAPNCYLLLIANLRQYLATPLTFCSKSRYAHINNYRNDNSLNYPIGLLNDIEIHFLHYQSEAEATEKWHRRLARVVTSDQNIYVKFCDREQCSEEQIIKFDSLPLKNKVCFLATPQPNLKSTVWIPESEENQVVDGLSLSSISPDYFDSVDWLNGGNGVPKWYFPLNSI